MTKPNHFSKKVLLFLIVFVLICVKNFSQEHLNPQTTWKPEYGANSLIILEAAKAASYHMSEVEQGFYSERPTHTANFQHDILDTVGETRKYRLIVKFMYDYVLDFDQGALIFSPQKEISQNDILTLHKYNFYQVLKYSNEERKKMRKGMELPPRGESSFNIFRFRGMAYLKGAEELSLSELLEIASELEKLDFVEYTALEPIEPPPPPSFNYLVPPEKSTPAFTDLQYYRKYIHKGDTIGINIDYAWSIDVFGEGIRVADIEWGFDYDHEDLKRDSFIELLPTTNTSSNDHGTAVAGVMYAIENDFGVTGMVHQADTFYGISEIPHGRVYGIALGLENLRAGDVFLYEMQTWGQNNNYVPADYNQAVWDITQSASEAGVIVVAAAGNGSEDLDDPFYDDYHARGDNGSIIVGAGTIRGRNRASFSTYGSRINVQGWGDWSVTTAGYGALYNGGPHATYTDRFSGTSSATPIVASAVVAVQSFAKNFLGFILTPQEMRELLIETGTEQGSGWGEGNLVPQPDVEAAIEKLLEDAGDVYLLNLIAEPKGSGILTGRRYYEEGELVTITADANPGYKFINWTGDIDYVDDPDSQSANVTMPAYGITVIANFNEQMPEIAVDQEPIYQQLGYLDEADQTLIINNIGEENSFLVWNVEIDFINGDKEKNNKSVWLSVSPSSGELIAGDNVELTIELKSENIQPDTYEAIIEIHSNDPENSIVLIPVTCDVDYQLYSLTLAAQPSDGGTVNGSGEYEENQEVRVSANSNYRYLFVNWTDELDNVVETEPIFYFTIPDNDVTFNANFELISYTVSFTVEDDNGNSIQNAIISLEDEENDEGDYVFERVVPGNYNYIVSAEGFFDSEDAIKVTNKDLTESVIMSVDDTHIAGNNSFELNIYPNPARDAFTVESSEVIQHIRMIDTHGRLIKDIVVDNVRSEIPVSNLQPGVFFLQIHSIDKIITKIVQISN